MQVLAIAQSKVNASIHKFVTCFYGRLPYERQKICRSGQLSWTPSHPSAKALFACSSPRRYQRTSGWKIWFWVIFCLLLGLSKIRVPQNLATIIILPIKKSPFWGILHSSMADGQSMESVVGILCETTFSESSKVIHSPGKLSWVSLSQW